MVRITKRSRRRMIEQNYSLKGHKYLNRHYLHVYILAMVALAVAIYFFVLSKEERAVAMAAANSAPRIIASAKPFLMYGTAWKEGETAKHVKHAIMAGFRFIDTACQPKHYNEAGVGAGWTAAAHELGLKREDIFLQTKFTPISGQDPNRVPYDPSAEIEEQVEQSLKVSLENLRTDYLDSLVLHSPLDSFDATVSLWRKFESLVDRGQVRRLGISNCYEFDYFQSLYNEVRIKPSVLQNRFHADSDFDTELRQFCKNHNIWYQSFWTLTANRRALAQPQVREWAESKDLSPQTLMFAFLMSLNYVKPLSGTTSEQHMREDVEVMERLQRGEKIFETEEDFQRFAEILGMEDQTDDDGTNEV